LKDLRVALCLFAESATNGLLEADSEIQRVGLWLKNEQLRYWKSQIVSRSELLTRAKIALNQKKTHQDAVGRAITPASMKRRPCNWRVDGWRRPRRNWPMCRSGIAAWNEEVFE
jgi:hypothetical protein